MPSTVFLDRAINQRNPELFGRYHLLGRIAIGGMAEVYVARCGELLGLQTLIAVKRILPVHAADESFVRMFQREAAIALRLQHQNIARVFEVGKVGDSWFLSMELVQGENIARVGKRLAQIQMRWPADVLAYVGSEVARALHYAHALKDAKGRPLNIVHRDVSPENVMLGFDGSVKMIDFGIAICEMYARETTAGAVRGKVQYVSPEQALGKDLDGRSDVFSLGVLLYEALAGIHPFDRGQTMSTLDAVIKDPVPAISGVSRAMNAVLAKALEKDRERRFATAEEMAHALLNTLPQADRVGPGQIQELTTYLFPGRTRRWRQIQEIAGNGLGFTQDDLTPVPETPSPEPVTPEPEPMPAQGFENGTTRVDPPGYFATITTSFPQPRKTTRRQGLLVAAAAALLVGGGGVLGLSTSRRRRAESPDAPAAPPSTVPTAPVATEAEATETAGTIDVEPLPTPEPPATADPPPAVVPQPAAPVAAPAHKPTRPTAATRRKRTVAKRTTARHRKRTRR